MSTATYQAIIDTIDAAILAGVSGPGMLRLADGRVIEYRSLTDLMAVRAEYASLTASSAGKPGFKLTGIQNGSSRL